MLACLRNFPCLVTILRMVTIQLQPFPLYMNLALKNSYIGHEFGSQISLTEGRLDKKRGDTTTLIEGVAEN